MLVLGKEMIESIYKKKLKMLRQKWFPICGLEASTILMQMKK